MLTTGPGRRTNTINGGSPMAHPTEPIENPMQRPVIPTLAGAHSDEVDFELSERGEDVDRSSAG